LVTLTNKGRNTKDASWLLLGDDYVLLRLPAC